MPPLTFEESSALYRAFLLDAVDGYPALGDGLEPVLYMSSEADLAATRELLVAGNGTERDGTEGDGIESWREGGREDESRGRIEIEIRAQRGVTLGERLEAAFDEAFSDGCAAACAIGTDHPTLPLDYIRRALHALDGHDLAIGPADDGGYYLLALRQPRPELFREMPYSTPDLFDATIRAAEHLALKTHILPVWYDVDDAASLRRLIDDSSLLPPGSRTLRALAPLQERFGGKTADK